MLTVHLYLAGITIHRGVHIAFHDEGESDGEHERTEVLVTSDAKDILGVTCTVVSDRVWVDDELAEETLDWYAQDQAGNVWYFGEDSKEIEDGSVVSTKGSWEAGVDGAMPGIVMPAQPQTGASYRQEYYAGEAEDMAEVLSLDELMKVAFGSYQNCLKTKEWMPLEPDVVEHKYYASLCDAASPGIQIRPHSSRARNAETRRGRGRDSRKRAARLSRSRHGI